jgi:phage tail P2-like protein
MSVSIQDISLVDLLTPALKQDQFFLCLAQTLDPMLADIRAQVINSNVLPRLHAQTSATLDFLAHYHFNVDVYSDTLDTGVKLLLVQNAILNKIRKGTPSAVKAAMNAAFSYCELVEWWQTNPPGPHDTFRIKIADPLVDSAKVNSMIQTVLKVKNARSYFAGIFSFTPTTPGTVYVGGVIGEYDYQILPYNPTVL